MFSMDKTMMIMSQENVFLQIESVNGYNNFSNNIISVINKNLNSQMNSLVRFNEGITGILVIWIEGGNIIVELDWMVD